MKNKNIGAQLNSKRYSDFPPDDINGRPNLRVARGAEVKAGVNRFRPQEKSGNICSESV
jgi:hypothetical protein